MSPCAGGNQRRGTGGLRGRNSGRRGGSGEGNGGWGGESAGPPPVGAAAAVVSNTDHELAVFFCFGGGGVLRGHPLPAAPSGKLEEGGAGSAERQGAEGGTEAAMEV